MPAGAFSEDRDPVGVAAERSRIGLDPAQGRDQVENPESRSPVERVIRLGPQGRVREMRERSQPVLRHDDDDILVDGELRTVIALGRAPDIRAAMNPHHNRQVFAAGRGIDVEIEAIFGPDPQSRLDAAPLVERIGHLRTPVGLGQRVQIASPGMCRSRRAPAQIAHRWGCVGNAVPDTGAERIGEPGQLTLFDRDARIGVSHRIGRRRSVIAPAARRQNGK